jgi:hypothetical protein
VVQVVEPLPSKHEFKPQNYKKKKKKSYIRKYSFNAKEYNKGGVEKKDKHNKAK